MSVNASDTISGMKDAAKGMLKKGICLPDRVDREKHPVLSKLAYIALDVTLIGLGILSLYFPMLVSGGHIPANPFLQFQNPGFQTIMGMAPCMLLAGIGLSWLTQDVVGDKAAKEMAKVKKIAAFLFCLCASGVFIAIGCQGHAIQAVSNPYTWYGLMILGFSPLPLESD